MVKKQKKQKNCFSTTNKKGVEQYLHTNGKIYWFSKDESNCTTLPEKFKTKLNPKTGHPYITKK